MEEDMNWELPVEEILKLTAAVVKVLDILLSCDLEVLGKAVSAFGNPVYEFSVSADEGTGLSYRSRDLFGKKAVLLDTISLGSSGISFAEDANNDTDDFNCDDIELPYFSYDLEIWLVEGDDFQFTSCYRVQVGETPEYAEYRVCQSIDAISKKLDIDDFDFAAIKRRVQELCKKAEDRGYPLVENA